VRRINKLRNMITNIVNHSAVGSPQSTVWLWINESTFSYPRFILNGKFTALQNIFYVIMCLHGKNPH